MSNYNKGFQDQGTTRPYPKFDNYMAREQYKKGRDTPPPPPPRPVTIIKKD